MAERVDLYTRGYRWTVVGSLKRSDLKRLAWVVLEVDPVAKWKMISADIAGGSAPNVAAVARVEEVHQG
jgi:hypothetical protein